jgi:hypothetical protein
MARAASRYKYVRPGNAKSFKISTRLTKLVPEWDRAKHRCPNGPPLGVPSFPAKQHCRSLNRPILGLLRFRFPASTHKAGTRTAKPTTPSERRRRPPGWWAQHDTDGPAPGAGRGRPLDGPPRSRRWGALFLRPPCAAKVHIRRPPSGTTARSQRAAPGPGNARPPDSDVDPSLSLNAASPSSFFTCTV